MTSELFILNFAFRPLSDEDSDVPDEDDVDLDEDDEDDEDEDDADAAGEEGFGGAADEER